MAYREWSSDTVKNEVVIPYVSMHGSTEKMVMMFARFLVGHGVTVLPFDLTKTDLGKLAIALVDAATVVFATPTVLLGPHPLAVYAACVANALKPKTRFVSFVGSFGWGGRTVEQLQSILGQVKAEFIPAVFIKGAPKSADYGALATLAETIVAKHKGIGLG